MLHAIILAAGRGTRLGARGVDRPKALLEIGGESLLARHHRLLTAGGVDAITVVVGHEAEAMCRVAEPLGMRTVLNAVFESTFSGHSLHLALAELDRGVAAADPVLFMDADLLYAPATLGPLLERPGDGILVGEGREEDEEAVKVHVREDRVVSLRKKPPQAPGAFAGESVGIVRLSPEGRRALVSRTRRLVGMGEEPFEWEEAVESILDERAFAPVRAGGPFIEIDFEHDLARAEREHAQGRFA